MKNIQARLLKGFRDFRGDELRIRKAIFAIFEKTFQSYGYEPLETPTLEYFDILMGKYGEEEKLVYQFDDHGGRRVAMKYDLTVPTSRVMAQYKNEITLPWKRYQIQPVWRADNTQKGRFREFYQLDADTYGVKECIVDAEFIDMGIDILNNLGFKEFRVRLNNRKILNAIAQYAGRTDKFFDIVYAIDKWDKRTPEETKSDLISRMQDNQYTQEQIISQVEKVMSCVQLDATSNTGKLDQLEQYFAEIEEGKEGIAEIREILTYAINADYIVYDPTIARGLAYYTGPVWEFQIIEGGVGSVGGCGRYDKLVGQFIGEDIYATGGSFGVERIIEVMKDRDMFTQLLPATNKTLVVALSKDSLVYSYKLANQIRKLGFTIMLYPVVNKLPKVINYALTNKYTKMIIVGEDEIRDGVMTIKDLTNREQKTITLAEVEQELLI